MKISVITVCSTPPSTSLTRCVRSPCRTVLDPEHLIIHAASRDDRLRFVEQHARPWRRIVSETTESTTR
jgi:hypothetical protein